MAVIPALGIQGREDHQFCKWVSSPGEFQASLSHIVRICPRTQNSKKRWLYFLKTMRRRKQYSKDVNWNVIYSPGLGQIFTSKGAVVIAQGWLARTCKILAGRTEIHEAKTKVRSGEMVSLHSHKQYGHKSFTVLFDHATSEWQMVFRSCFLFFLLLFICFLVTCLKNTENLFPEFCLCYLVRDKFSLIGIWKRLKNAWV